MLDKKTSEEIKILREGGKILSDVLRRTADKAKIGATGVELDEFAESEIIKAGGKPAFKNYQGFPNTLCVSVNQTVVHGIPNDLPFQEGDLVGLDIGMEYKGLYTDMATTVPVGKISKANQKLLDVTKKALEIGIAEVAPGKHIGDIGAAIEKYVKQFNYGIIRDLAGHGVGREVHEAPMVPNYDPKDNIAEMFTGMVIAIEPMLVLGGDHNIVTAENNWDILSRDNTMTAHFEHTIAVTDDGHMIITK